MNKCPYCYNSKGFVEVHGATMCLTCGAKVVGCCGEDGCII
jgi:hypothetical protein